MIDNETKEILEISAYLIAIGEGLIKVGSYIAQKVEKKRFQESAKPSKRRKKRKRQ